MDQDFPGLLKISQNLGKLGKPGSSGNWVVVQTPVQCPSRGITCPMTCRGWSMCLRATSTCTFMVIPEALQKIQALQIAKMREYKACVCWFLHSG